MSSRMSELREFPDGSYSARIFLTPDSSRRFSEMTMGFRSTANKGFVPGFYIDSVVAAAFDHALAKSGMARTPVSISTAFENYFCAGTPAEFRFSPGAEMAADVRPESGGGTLCRVKISYGEPPVEMERTAALASMPLKRMYAVQPDALNEFLNLTRASPEWPSALPMLALSYVSNAVLKSVELLPEPVVEFKDVGPLTVWGYGLKDVEHDNYDPSLPENFDYFADGCLRKGTVFYNSHIARFFSGAYKLLPSEAFTMYVDYSHLRRTRVPENSSNVSGLHGPVQAEAVLPRSGERVFELTAGIKAIRA